MPSCAIITCKARSQVSSVAKEGISFHRFPKDPDIRLKWIDATGRQNWMPTKCSTICSKHFSVNDYDIKKSGNRYLKEDAIPHEKVVRLRYSTNNETTFTLLPIGSNNTSDVKSQKRTLSEATNKEDGKRVKVENDVGPLPSTSSTTPVKESSTKNSHYNVPSCNSSNTSTPRVKNLKQIITTKETVIKRQRKNIKKVQAQNRRLKKKVYKMENIINDLQHKCLLRHEDLNVLKHTNMQGSEDEEGQPIYEDDSHNFVQSVDPSDYSIATSLVEVSENSKHYSDVDDDGKSKRHCPDGLDEYDAIGINVAAKLRNLAPNMRILAEKLINDVLFQAQINGLSSSTVIITADPFKQDPM